MTNDLIKTTGLTYEDVLAQVKYDYDRGYSLVENKRAKFELDLKLYNSEKKNKKKIGDTTVYNIHTALLARLYMSRVDTTFEGTEIGQEALVDNLNSTYQDDFESEDMANLKYQRYWDALFYGVGITAKIGWDGLKKKTVFQNIDPRLWIPDPDGDYLNGNYSFTGFEKLATKSWLKSNNLWNEDLTPSKNTGVTDKGPQKVQQDDQNRAGLNPGLGNDGKYNTSYVIYYHFGTFNGVKALVITGNDNTVILGTKVLPAVYDYEKKKAEKIEFPFDFTYYRPIRGDVFGKSVPDDTGDIQRVKAIIANLRLDKSMAELYPMYLANTRLLKNKTDLDFGFNKLIEVNPLEGESVSNALQPLQKDFRSDNSYIIDNSLDQQVERATSIGAIAQGSDPQRRETATTNKLLQGNTDININLTAKHFAQGDKRIALLWLRGLIENFTGGDTKKVKIYNGISYLPIELKKSDFIGADKVKIIVKSEAEVSEKRQKEINAFNMALPILQTAGIPKSSSNFLYRDFLRNLGYDEKKVWVAIPQTPEEVIVMQDIEVLNAGERVSPNPEIDVNTALLLIKQAKPGLNKEMYIMELLEMYTAQLKTQAAQGLPGEENPQEQAMKNNVAAQAGAGLQNMAQQFTG